MRNTFFVHGLLFIILNLFFIQILSSQEDNPLEGLNIKKGTYKIQLQEHPTQKNMQVAYYEGELENGKIRLLQTGLHILQPVFVTLIPKNPKDKLSLNILKSHWQDVIRSADNIKEGHQESFRTRGDFGIEIKSKNPSALFYLAVWVHDKIKIDQSNIFYPVSNFEDEKPRITGESNAFKHPDKPTTSSPDENGISSYIKIIAFALIGIFILLLLLLFRRKRKTSQFILIMCFSLFQLNQTFAGLKSMNPIDGDKLMEIYQAIESIDKLANQINDWGNTVMDLKKAIDGLSKRDDSYLPDYDPRGMPQLPSSCFEMSQRSGGDRNSQTNNNTTSSQGGSSSQTSTSNSGSSTRAGGSGAGSGSSNNDSGNNASSNNRNTNSSSNDGGNGLNNSNSNSNTNSSGGNSNDDPRNSNSSNQNNGSNSSSQYQLVTLYGHIYFDQNGDGTQQSGEANLNDISVKVMYTDPETGTYSGMTKDVATDNQGYWYTFVPKGSTISTINVASNGFPIGAEQTEGQNPSVVTISGQRPTNAGNDGYYLENWEPNNETTFGSTSFTPPNAPLLSDTNEPGNSNQSSSAQADGANLTNPSSNNTSNTNPATNQNGGGSQSNHASQSNSNASGPSANSDSHSGGVDGDGDVQRDTWDSSTNSSTQTGGSSSSSSTSSSSSNGGELGGATEGNGVGSRRRQPNELDPDAGGVKPGNQVRSGDRFGNTPETACKCLEDAYYTFYELRRLMESNLAIYKWQHDYVDWAVKFGDGASSVHGVSALAWSKQKIGIIKSLKNGEAKYNEVYQSTIDQLYENLMEIDRCERLLGFNDWYRRSGFMFYEFSKLKYEK